jgi:uncharacterized protein (DUF1330 family)
MAVYVIADIDVQDAAGYEEYRLKVPGTIAAHGGRYLARGGAIEVLEGAWSPKRLAIVEFPDMERFQGWWSSPEYSELRKVRERTTKSQLVVTQGV